MRKTALCALFVIFALMAPAPVVALAEGDVIETPITNNMHPIEMTEGSTDPTGVEEVPHDHSSDDQSTEASDEGEVEMTDDKPVQDTEGAGSNADSASDNAGTKDGGSNESTTQKQQTKDSDASKSKSNASASDKDKQDSKDKKDQQQGSSKMPMVILAGALALVAVCGVAAFFVLRMLRNR